MRTAMGHYEQLNRDPLDKIMSSNDMYSGASNKNQRYETDRFHSFIISPKSKKCNKFENQIVGHNLQQVSRSFCGSPLS